MQWVLTSSFSVLLAILLVVLIPNTPGFSSPQAPDLYQEDANIQSSVFSPLPGYKACNQRGNLDLIFAQKDREENQEFHPRFPELKESAELGYAIDQLRLGIMYANGLGVSKDVAEAVRWYRKAAEQGNADAQGKLGLMYEEGQGVDKNEVEAARWYRKSADQGDADAQVRLGIMYEEGQGVDKDEAEAVRWYRKSADQGHAVAQYCLGLMYAKGQGVGEDEAEAAQWFRKSADQGDADAQYFLGRMYEEGQGVDKDEVEAARWYRKSADQGDAGAQYFLGRMYEEGQGVGKDEAEAVRWYRKSADQGHAVAQYFLGSMYAEGKGISKNEAEAARWYRKSADQGDADAQVRLGIMYEEGQGVDKDEAEAVRWYRKSADQGNADAQFYLGTMYAEGLGVVKDEAEAAIRWFKKAADQGHAGAQCYLGILYTESYDVPKNVEEARGWFEKARAQNSVCGYSGLGYMEAKSGRFEEALSLLNSVIDRDAEQWHIYLLRGKVFLAKGDTSSALQDFKKVHSFDLKDDKDRCEIMASLAAGQMVKGDAVAARKSIQDALAMDGENREALVLSGLILGAEGEYADAETNFRQVLEKNPDFGPAIWGLADAQFQLKKFQDAEGTLNQISQDKTTQDLAEFDILAFCPACFEDPFQTAALHGKLIEAGRLSNRQILEWSKNLDINYLRNACFLSVDGRPRMVGTKEALLFDPDKKTIVFPYPGIAVSPEDLAEGDSAEIVGKGKLEQQTLAVHLKIFTDFSPVRIMFNDAALPLTDMTWTGFHFFPALRYEYRLRFDLPVDLARGANRLIVESRDGKSHIFTLSLVEGKLKVSPMERPAVDKL